MLFSIFMLSAYFFQIPEFNLKSSTLDISMHLPKESAWQLEHGHNFSFLCLGIHISKYSLHTFMVLSTTNISIYTSMFSE